jgi:hypothetical protein
MLGLRDGRSHFPVSDEGQMQKQVTQLAQDVGIATSDVRRHEATPGPSSRQEESEANVLGLIVQYPPKLSALRRSNGKTAEFLLHLETENAELRHQAVELALQIQKLVESQVR